MLKRIFYSTGPGNLIAAHEYWKRNEHDPTEVSVTFSSQIQDFCRDIGAETYVVGQHASRTLVRDGAFTLEHRPKPHRRGALFHISEIAYGLGLLRTALRFRAQVALIDSGSTHHFVLVLFRLFGIRVIPILHNTLWPSGFFPTKTISRLLFRLDYLFFWSWVPIAAIAVSPECARQVDQLGRRRGYQIHQIRAQFERQYFASIPPAPSHDQRPFRVMFIGRINRIKGVFDILQIARAIEDDHPGLVRWEICGRGADFEALKALHERLKLEEIVSLRGWTSLEDLRGVYAISHASIVPTRSSFIEGLAMTAAEAILAGRPLITNPVVPALEVLKGASVEARTDDVDSHRDAVLRLATDRELYARLAAACAGFQEQFYDREQGLTAVLKRILSARAAGNS